MKDEVGASTLDVMTKAKFYNLWLFSLIKPFLGRKVLEAGAGSGNFSSLLSSLSELTAVDYDKDYVKILKKSDFKAGFGDLEKGKFFFSKQEKFDSIVNLNVLEHIKDDQKTLNNFYNLLNNGGNLILLTPAHQFAYSEIDKNLGHFRRYELEDLEKKLQKSGFKIVEKRYLNVLGLLGWFVSGKLLRKKQLEEGQIGIFELISKPLLLIEKIISFDFGLSVFIVAKRDDKKQIYKKLSIVIPVYNEQTTVEKLIKKVKVAKLNLKKEIIVVNDGSTDKTSKILKNIKGVILINKKNEGKGSAVIEGLKKASGDVIIIQDADLEYDPADYQKLVNPILKNETNVVYGSRLKELKLNLFGLNKTPLPLHYFANKILTLGTNIIFGSKLTDMETCYKVFSRRVINPGALSSKGFEIEPELTAYFLKRKEEILEVPITVKPRSYSEGKKIKASDAVIAVKTLLSKKLFK